MTALSVNVNKVALLRNSRSLGIPSVIGAARAAIAAGASGITVHPRPDQRHIRPSDVMELAELLHGHPGVEFNIEGNPFPEYLALVRSVQPAQCTLVPDTPEALTSNQGWDLDRSSDRLEPIIRELRALGTRVSLFMDATSTGWHLARELGAERVELYTEPYAVAFARGDYAKTLDLFARAARSAQAEGLGVNAGHDLNLENLRPFLDGVEGVLEVSIGHALVSDALEMGMQAAVRTYLDVIAAKGIDALGGLKDGFRRAASRDEQ